MVFTNAQITSFFQDADQMGLSNRTRIYLQGEGIDHPDDLAEFLDKETWDQIIENCKRPPQVPAPGGGAGLVAQQPFLLPAKSLMRLKTAARIVDYYQRTARPLTAGNMAWVRLNNFRVEWRVIQDRKKANDELTLPVVSKQLTIVAFFEAYESYVTEFIGAANCPLSWIYREEVAVAGPVPPLETDQPYSTTHKSVANEMVHRYAHTHPLYRVDNATGYSQLVTATLGTQYSSTIAPFKRARNGRGALEALKAQFAGAAYWDREVKTMMDFMINMRWTGTTSFSLHGFLAKHRASYNTLQRCAEHVAVELPNERTRVGYLIENIDCQDKDVTTAVSHVRLDDTTDATGNPSGTRNDFERAVAFLLPMDPVGKKRRGGKRTAAQISSATGGNETTAEVAACGGDDPKKGRRNKTTFKSSHGKTGVEFRYYKPAEFSKLTDEQRAELKEHRQTNGNYRGTWKGKKGENANSGRPKKNGPVNRRDVHAMMRDHDLKKQKESAEYEEFKAAIVDELRGNVTPAATVAQATAPSNPSLKRILKRAGAKADGDVASTEVTFKEPTVSNPFVQENEAEVAERLSNKLYAKFKSIGSKARRKTG